MQETQFALDEEGRDQRRKQHERRSGTRVGRLGQRDQRIDAHGIEPFAAGAVAPLQRCRTDMRLKVDIERPQSFQRGLDGKRIGALDRPGDRPEAAGIGEGDGVAGAIRHVCEGIERLVDAPERQQAVALQPLGLEDEGSPIAGPGVGQDAAYEFDEMQRPVRLAS